MPPSDDYYDDDDYDRHCDSAKATRMDAHMSHACGRSSTTRSQREVLDPRLDNYVKDLKNHEESTPSKEFKTNLQEKTEKPPVVPVKEDKAVFV